MQPGRPDRRRRPRPALADPLVLRSPGRQPASPHRPRRRVDIGVAARALPDGTTVIISGGVDRTVRV